MLGAKNYFIQHLAGWYPLLSASSVDEKQILFSGFIFAAHWQVGRIFDKKHLVFRSRVAFQKL